MQTRELFETYRETLLNLDELQMQLERTGTDGRPAGCRGLSVGEAARGTNAPAAAAFQLADGLEELAERKRSELARMAPLLYEQLRLIRDYRTFMVVQHYYLMAETDSSIAMTMNLTRERVNQIRRRYLRSL